MMNLRNTMLIFVFAAASIFAQTASNYFPSQTGYKWNFKLLPLDSLNNPVDSLEFYGIDSFAVVTNYAGKTADVVLSKTGTLNTVNSIPFLDSTFYNFDGTNGYEYFNPGIVSGLLGNVDTTLGINFVTFFNSLEGWYSYYRFASNVNQSYEIISKDTTVTIDSITLPVRLDFIGKRLSDETINTEIGSFNCKKFLLERKLNYLIWIPPLPNPVPVPILSIKETVWIAPDNWKVKSYIPSTNIDLFVFGIPSFSIPGLETNITTPITDVEKHYPEIVNDFILYQNYPNPFNPSTTINYSIPEVISTKGGNPNVVLTIYDILGNEIATLVNEEKPAGNYEVNFNAVHLPSGVYFYQLKAANFFQTKKMILLK